MNTHRHGSNVRRIVVVIGALTAFTRARAAEGIDFGSGEDVAEILRANGVAPARMRCVNPRVGGHAIRAVACTTRLSRADVAALRGSVPLTRAASASQVDTGDCEHTPGLRSRDRGVVVYRGDNARVPNGVGPIEVHVAPATGAACIEIHYPWS